MLDDKAFDICSYFESVDQDNKSNCVHGWTYFEFAELEANEYLDGAIEIRIRGLLISRHVAGDDLTFSTLKAYSAKLSPHLCQIDVEVVDRVRLELRSTGLSPWTSGNRLMP